MNYLSLASRNFDTHEKFVVSPDHVKQNPVPMLKNGINFYVLYNKILAICYLAGYKFRQQIKCISKSKNLQ